MKINKLVNYDKNVLPKESGHQTVMRRMVEKRKLRIQKILDEEKNQ